MCSCRCLDQAVETKAADIQHCVCESFFLQSTEQELQAQMLLSIGKSYLRDELCGNSSYLISVKLIPCAHICSFCKPPSLQDDCVSHLCCTYCIIGTHFPIVRLALCGGIQGFMQAFSLAAHRHDGMTCYKPGACM